MKIIRNNIIPFKGFTAINLFGILFVRKKALLTGRILRHEKIHTEQMKELWYIGFYFLYISLWLSNLLIYGNNRLAYRNIPFENEAYENEHNIHYLKTRKRFAWLKN